MRGRATVGTVAAVAMAASLVVACGSTAQQAATTSTTASPQKTPSKLPAAVTRTVDRLKAGEKPGTDASFTDSGVPVRDDGKIQLELHSSGPVTDTQKAELTALGAEIVASGGEVGARGDNGNLTPYSAGIVDAWVPYARVDEAAALPWVVSVTVPSPTRAP